MNLIKAKDYIINKLKNELDSKFFYHGLHHTLDVTEAALRLANMENLDEHSTALLHTAALYHDSGILKVYKGHEIASAELVLEVLPLFDYKENEIKTIIEIILATQLPQKPKNILEQIICDADLDYLGRDDFYVNAMNLYREWTHHGVQMSLKEWYLLQVEFMQNHKYFTASSIKLRQEQKMLHLAQLKELLNI